MVSEIRISNRDYTESFFEDEKTKSTIRALAETPRLTIFVGAGASMDQGMPSWAQLVVSLFISRAAISSGKQKKDLIEETAKKLAEKYHQLPMASIVDSLFPTIRPGEKPNSRNHRNTAIREMLYGKRKQKTSLGLESTPYLAHYILVMASTLRHLGKDVSIVTTNYDDSLTYLPKHDRGLERWLRKLDLEFRQFDAPPDSTLSSQTIPVVHIHGSIPQRGEMKNVIFSELDYAAQRISPIFDEYLIDRLSRGGHVLFVGTSLRDYDLTSHLIEGIGRSRSEKFELSTRVALQPIQGELDGFPRDLDLFQDHVADYATFRASQLQVDMLRPDFFGQVYQFLNEVAQTALTPPPALEGGEYQARLNKWWEAWKRDYNDEAVRRSVTVDLQKQVDKWRGGFRSTSQMKIEIWGRSYPKARNFELWCSSQSMWLPGAGSWPHKARISSDSPYAAIGAFANRANIRGQVKNQRDDRWTHFIAIPVCLTANPYSDLPVGSVVALFHAPELRDPTRYFELQDAVYLNKFEKALLTMGLEILTPPAAI